MSHKIKIALVQSPLVWEDPETNRKHFAKSMADVQKDTDLVILPEMFISGFTMHPEHMGRGEGEKTLSWMQSLASDYGMALVGSLPFYSEGSFSNRLLFVHPDGNYQWYDKRHTFTLAGEDKVYRRGTERLLVSFKGFKICPLICYDLRFPVWARNHNDYDVLIYCANWPAPRINAWDALLKARAIENMAYCIGVNRIGNDEVGHAYPGHSAVFDVLGERIAYSEKEEIVYATLSTEHIKEYRNKLRFLEDADRFTLES